MSKAVRFRSPEQFRQHAVVAQVAVQRVLMPDLRGRLQRMGGID